LFAIITLKVGICTFTSIKLVFSHFQLARESVTFTPIVRQGSLVCTPRLMVTAVSTQKQQTDCVIPRPQTFGLALLYHSPY